MLWRTSGSKVGITLRERFYSDAWLAMVARLLYIKYMLMDVMIELVSRFRVAYKKKEEGR